MEIPTKAVEMAEERLSSKEEAMYETAYATLREATSNASATEAVVKNQSTAAAVATLASAVESAENSALSLIAQAGDILSFGGPNPASPGVSTDWKRIDWEDASVDLSREGSSRE